MRKRVPLSSVISRVIVPSYLSMAFCTEKVACCTTSSELTSHGFGPSPSTCTTTTRERGGVTGWE